MKKKSGRALLFLILFFSVSNSESQSLEGSLLQGLNQEFSRQQGQTQLLPDEEQKEESAEVSERKIPQNFEDENYGFTGGKKFNLNPKARFSEIPLEYFGYDFFSDAPSTFAPVTNIPIPQDYIIGPGDNIRVLLFGNKNNQFTLKVSRDGDIFFPEIGSINIAGLTFSEMKETIRSVVRNQIIGTEANISLGNLRSINIFILGDAFQPGMYTVSALSTLTNAIFAGGGIGISGSLRNIQLKRNGQVISEFDLYELLLNGNTNNDKRLMSGDVIFIPPVSKTVGIEGEVARPGIYELKENENLNELISYAGNLKPKANFLNAELKRINKPNNSFDLSSIKIDDTNSSGFKLKNGDVISVYPIADNLRNAVLLSGHAQQPGFYAWKEGMKVSELLKNSDDLLEMTDISYLLIKRKRDNDQSYEFLQVDLEEVFSNKNSDEDLILLDQDELILLPWMLSSDLIKTRLIVDQYQIDTETNKLVLEDEWTSMTYLRKSLMEETLDIKEQNNILQAQNTVAIDQDESEIDIRRYYEYSIFDYCTIPEDLAILIIEDSGFRAKKSIPLEDLERINSPEDIIELQKAIERERAIIRDSDDDQISKTITDLCRRQLLDPVIDLVRANDNDDELDIVSIFGNVHFPGVYPYTNKMILMDAINAAGGPKNGTYDAEIELISRSNVGKRIAASSTFSSITEAKTVPIREMDTINLKQISLELRTVEVTGEVFFPGIYPLTENETLTDVIRRAGGITEYGSAKAAYFQRDTIKEAEISRFRDAQEELKRKIILGSNSGGVGTDSLDSNSIVQLTELITVDQIDEETLGRIVIDLESILNMTKEDVVLESGDSINIPKRKQSVSVIGEVYVANSHIYNTRNTIDDYINLSGGSTDFADVNNIYIIKSDGSIISPSQMGSGFFRSNQSDIEPGDAIVVPLQVQPFSGIRATTEVTQIIYQMALAAAAVNSF